MTNGSVSTSGSYIASRGFLGRCFWGTVRSSRKRVRAAIGPLPRRTAVPHMARGGIGWHPGSAWPRWHGTEGAEEMRLPPEEKLSPAAGDDSRGSNRVEDPERGPGLAIPHADMILGRHCFCARGTEHGVRTWLLLRYGYTSLSGTTNVFLCNAECRHSSHGGQGRGPRPWPRRCWVRPSLGLTRAAGLLTGQASPTGAGRGRIAPARVSFEVVKSAHPPLAGWEFRRLGRPRQAV